MWTRNFEIYQDSLVVRRTDASILPHTFENGFRPAFVDIESKLRDAYWTEKKIIWISS